MNCSFPIIGYLIWSSRCCGPCWDSRRWNAPEQYMRNARCRFTFPKTRTIMNRVILWWNHCSQQQCRRRGTTRLLFPAKEDGNGGEPNEPRHQHHGVTMTMKMRTCLPPCRKIGPIGPVTILFGGLATRRPSPSPYELSFQSNTRPTQSLLNRVHD
jgi:hypothetical protein